MKEFRERNNAVIGKIAYYFSARYQSRLKNCISYLPFFCVSHAISLLYVLSDLAGVVAAAVAIVNRNSIA